MSSTLDKLLEQISMDPAGKASIAAVGAVRAAGELMTQARHDAGLTMPDIAKALECDVEEVWRHEAGVLSAKTTVLQLAATLAHYGKRLKLTVEVIE